MKKINFNIVGKFGTILADPPWEFNNRTGKIAPENKKLKRYKTMNLEDIKSLPIDRISAKRSHLYLWVPNALIKEYGGEKYLFFSNTDSNNVMCDKPSSTKFKCVVYKNGEIVKQQ